MPPAHTARGRDMRLRPRDLGGGALHSGVRRAPPGDTTARAARSRRRIGLVIGQLTYGGAEGQLFELARGLCEAADPVVYCLSASDKPYGALLREAGIRVRVFPS